MTTTDPIGPNVNDPAAVTITKLRILHDYVVVRPLAPPSKKRGSLVHMPGTAQERERSYRGVVLRTGDGDWNEPGTARIPMSIAVGDLVFYGKYAGTEEEIGGDTVLVMREPECRMSVPAGQFALVEHVDAKLDHLVEDYCDVCHGIPNEEFARQALAADRAALVQSRSVDRVVDNLVEGTAFDRNT